MKKIIESKFLFVSSCFLAMICLLASCDDFLNASLDKSLIVQETIFSNDVTATSSVTAMYNTMTNFGPLSATPDGVICITSLSANELSNYAEDTRYVEFERHLITSQNSALSSNWNGLYNLIYQANAVIEGINGSNALKPKVASQLLGEAHFVRAFCYFYLVNMFGDVPLVLKTDYKENRILPRISSNVVYDQIEEDLLVAEDSMDEEYVSADRLRPNKATATALLARIYLYRNKHAQAESKCSQIIIDGKYQMEGVNDVFQSGSAETIWQIMCGSPYLNTVEGYVFVLQNTPSYHVLSEKLIGSVSVNDLRNAWIGSYYDASLDTTFMFPYKYKLSGKSSDDPKVENSIAFRLAEIYLIRAEAKTKIGDLSGAVSDLNVVHERAGLDPLELTSEQEILDAILKERELELFTEWGHRWFDLKRTGKAKEILNIGDNALLYPIPKDEFTKNPSLGLQNPGYNL